ncbi:MAG TPA: hypothetical protein VFY90_11450 [Tepidiformaceae bacterium]|nr:hypothetical protein [Tepidiformaceae bacterium]
MSSSTPSARTKARGWAGPRSRALSILLMVIGAVVIVPAVLFAWAEETIFTSDGFADAASQSLNDEAVQDRLAVGLTERIVEKNPDLARAQPLIQGAAARFVDSAQFQDIFRTAVERLHQRVFDEDSNELVLDLTAAISRILEIVRTGAPQLAERIPPNVDSALITISQSDFRTRLIRLADRVSMLAFILPVISLACFAGSLYLAPDRRAGAFRIGMGIAVAAAFVVLALLIGGRVITEFLKNPDNNDAATALWWAWVDSLRVTMRILGVIGVVVAAAAWWVANKGWPRRERTQAAT